MKAKLAKLSSVFMALAMSQSTMAETFKFNTDVSDKSDTLVVFKNDTKSTDFAKFDKQSEGQLTRALNANQFKGSYNTFVEVLAPNKLSYNRVLIVGTGDKALTESELTKLGGNIAAQLKGKHISDVSVAAEDFSADQASQLAHGINLRSYNFSKSSLATSIST